jgi:hypothetical protein
MAWKFFFLFCCAHLTDANTYLSGLSTDNGDGWSRADDHFLAHSLTPFDFCVLSSLGLIGAAVPGGAAGAAAAGIQMCSPPQSPAEAHCSILHSRMSHLAAWAPFFPQTLFDVPFELATRSSYQSLLTLSHFLGHLNATNRVLVLIGDSITRNTLEALNCALQREHQYRGVAVRPSLADSGGGGGGLHKKGGRIYEFSFPRPPGRADSSVAVVTVKILYFAIWVSGMGAVCLCDCCVL